MNRDCKHGNHARSCEICERDEIIERLRVAVDCAIYFTSDAADNRWTIEHAHEFLEGVAYELRRRPRPVLDVDALMEEEGE